jgi:hypothetical protein
MAFIAEMSATPAIPLSHCTTELALVLDICATMRFARPQSAPGSGSCTFPTNQLARVVLLPFVRVLTGLQPSEVRRMALMAQIIRQLRHCQLLRSLIVSVGGVLEAGAVSFFEAFEGHALDGFGFDVVVDSADFSEGF